MSRQQQTAKPYLKWAGGKQRSLPFLIPILSQSINDSTTNYVEPFCGSATIALNLPPNPNLSITLADANKDLITLHSIVAKSNTQHLFDSLSIWFAPITNTKSFYTWARSLYNTSTNPHLRAHLLLYLNRHSFNGLMRYNKQGQFNAPFGAYKQPVLPKTNLLAFHAFASSRNVHLLHANAFYMLNPTRETETSVYYLDPPYLTPHDDDANANQTPTFTSYTHAPFGPAEHERLAEHARTLADGGATVLISNADNERTRALYHDATSIQSYGILRSISRNGADRGNKAELLVTYRRTTP